MRNNFIEDYYFSAVHVLDGAFPEEKEDVRIGLEGTDELRLVQPLGIELIGSYGQPSDIFNDRRIGSGKVDRSADEINALFGHQRSYVGVRIVRTFGLTIWRSGHSVRILNL